MKSYLFCFYCFIGLSLGFADEEVVISLQRYECSSLVAIKASLIDPNDLLKDWKMPISDVNNSAYHCNWTGVGCNSRGFVEKLDLSGMNLSGNVSGSIQGLHSLSFFNICCNGFVSSLPKSFSNLTLLKSIDVSQNNFIGNFPTGLGNAAQLISVNASSNDFSGFLPDDLGTASSLEVIDFRGSYFEGSIPTSFKNLQKLKFLGLSGNNLSGKIPPELGQVSSLETIILGYNEFKGEIPAEFGNLTNLQYLDLAVGSLSGQIPAELGRLKNLRTVYLYKNNFTGRIPPEIGNITSLVFLDLSDNQISGGIPAELAEIKNLQLLNLMCNQLSGSIPKELGELTNLQVLELWKNNLTGSLPNNIGQNSPLQLLDVSSNSLSGEIPPGVCDNGNLTKLILFNNSFSGPIPIGLSTCQSLVRVRIQNNHISGTIPIGLGILPVLQRLEMANNILTGQIPEDIIMSTSISFIDVSWNQLQSSLPSTIFSSPHLENLIASNNNLSGNIPSQFQDCPSLSVLDLSNNHFSGQVPDSISSCEKLVKLNLRENQFSGEIPKSVGTLPTLAILDLSVNCFSGQIPVNLGTSQALEMLNLSYNKLEGPVPFSGILMNINPGDLVGNAGLCGGILPPCSQSLKASMQPKKLHIKHIMFGMIVGVSIILTLGIALFAGIALYRRWYLYNSCFDELFKSNGEWPWRLVAFQRVNFSSTELLACIKESNIIGMGGTGIVYKAEIYQHYAVAVKKLWRSGADVETRDDLLTEVNLLGRLRHRNIVRLLGYLHNKTEVMIVYEYMPNGNLGTTLHNKEADKLLVDWVSRYNIALGVAQGLIYLHNDCHPPIIHRDIKSTNILLDSNLEARIADFGLARKMIRNNETVSMVAGSYGYIAPEYGYTLKVDEKSDVYSFGVVLLELITGKMPLDPSFGENIDIVEWVIRTGRKNRGLEEALDPNIAAQCRHVQDEMLLALRIALLCTAKMPRDRPSMRDVITMLGEAKPRRKSICDDSRNSSSKDKMKFSLSPVLAVL